MILTAAKSVNARLGKPSTNAPNPRFLLPGDKVKVRSRALGDEIFGNSEWILTEENEFFSIEGFHLTEEIKSIPFLAHLQNAPQLFKDLEIAQLWNVSRGEGITIGLIDSGVAKHPSLNAEIEELNAKVQMSQALDGHGTTMACIIAAFDEARGKIGIAPKIQKIYSYTIADIQTLEPEELIIALDQMIEKKAKILNLSFSCDAQNFFLPRAGAVKLQEKINELANTGCIIVCATGNNNKRNQDFYPAKYENVISVAGYDSGGNLEVSSNLWNGVSVCMPSAHYFTDSQFKNSNGTSGATAITTGCIACVYHSIQGVNKTETINKLFSNFATVKPEFGPQIPVPKFDTKEFLHLIQS